MQQPVAPEGPRGRQALSVANWRTRYTKQLRNRWKPLRAKQDIHHIRESWHHHHHHHHHQLQQLDQQLYQLHQQHQQWYLMIMVHMVDVYNMSQVAWGFCVVASWLQGKTTEPLRWQRHGCISRAWGLRWHRMAMRLQIRMRCRLIMKQRHKMYKMYTLSLIFFDILEKMDTPSVFYRFHLPMIYS